MTPRFTGSGPTARGVGPLRSPTPGSFRLRLQDQPAPRAAGSREGAWLAPGLWSSQGWSRRAERRSRLTGASMCCYAAPAGWVPATNAAVSRRCL